MASKVWAHFEGLGQWIEISELLSGDSPDTVSSAQITDATAVGKSVLTAASAGAARTAIGAGTSDLAIGTSASSAKVGNYQPAAANISDATATGRGLLTAADSAAARTMIGAGTSSVVVGTGAGDAKAGNYQPTAANISDATATGRTVLTAADAAAARTAIGAGTSSLTIGATGSTVSAGNHTHAASVITASAVGTGTATNVQAILAELEARIAALETP